MIDYHLVKGANHFFKDNMDDMVHDVSTYLDARMGHGTGTGIGKRKVVAG